MAKRGEISSTQFILLVIAIIGFVILLGFLYLAFGNFDSLSSSEACRLSVLTRATAPTAAQSLVPLKCSTEKICITEGEECDEFLGQKKVSVVKLSGDANAKARAIERIAAESLYGCWNMMGQGKLDLFGKAFESYRDTESKCVVCSRVALGEVSQEVKDRVNFNQYLVDNKVPGSSITYWQAFTGDSGAQTFVGVSDNDLLKVGEDVHGEKIENAGEEISKITRTDDMAFVFAQRKSPDSPWEGFLSGAEDSTYALLGVAVSVPGGKLLAFNPWGWLVDALVVGGTGAYTAVNAYEKQQASIVYCGKFSSSVDNDDKKKGCSVVRMLPYSADSINSICSSIEGQI